MWSSFQTLLNDSVDFLFLPQKIQLLLTNSKEFKEIIEVAYSNLPIFLA